MRIGILRIGILRMGMLKMGMLRMGILRMVMLRMGMLIMGILRMGILRMEYWEFCFVSQKKWWNKVLISMHLQKLLCKKHCSQVNIQHNSLHSAYCERIL